jgi:soluble lytic murein transglycosylase-like protein
MTAGVPVSATVFSDTYDLLNNAPAFVSATDKAAVALLVGMSDRSKLFHVQTKLRHGCAILRMYLDKEGGNLYLAPGRYNGSGGRPQYPNAVLSAWNKWK